VASGEQIQAALRRFVAKWEPYAGSERSEAQTFLNELFACYGTDRLAVGARFEDFKSSAGFMDLHWPGICIIEMKAPNRDVSVAREQVRRYWGESSDLEHHIQAARWVVICTFRRFEIWEPGKYPNQPVASLSLAELPDRSDVLAFLSGPNVEPSFAEHHRRLTTQAARQVALPIRAKLAFDKSVGLDGNKEQRVPGREPQRTSKPARELTRFADLDAMVPRRLVRRELGEDTALVAGVPTASSGSRIEWPRDLLVPLEDVELPRPTSEQLAPSRSDPVRG
jgi:hypothetical protein